MSLFWSEVGLRLSVGFRNETHRTALRRTVRLWPVAWLLGSLGQWVDSLFFFFFVRAGQWASVILLVRIEQSIVMVRSGSILIKSKVDSSHGVSEVVCKGESWSGWIFLGRFFYAHSPRRLLKILDGQSQCYYRDVFFGDSTFLRRI